MPNGHILITGASGLVGRAAMEHFARGGYRVTAVSRRRPFDTYGATWHSVDLADEAACRDTFGGMGGVTQIVFAALHEEPELVAGWTQQKHVDRNGAMLRNTLEPVAKTAKGLKNVTILQGPKAYGVHVKPLRPGAREDRDEDRTIPNFYWAQEDYLKDRQHGQGWGWTVMRPALVVGECIGGAMNLIAALGVYAALLKAKGQPLHYPGGNGALLEATDTDLMAHAFEWAGSSDAAQNQTFNLTNGELFSLKDQWPVIAECLGMAVGDDIPLGFEDELPREAAAWDRIRSDANLIAPDMAAYLGQSLQFADFVLARTYKGPVSASSVSSIKIRQAGFNDCLYTDAMLRKWFARYQADLLLPSV
jgi:nucleoside-diphosphate-sugar epimerase